MDKEISKVLIICRPETSRTELPDPPVVFKSRTFRSRKVDDVSIRLEHVDLLNGLNRLDIQLLERSLQLLVVNTASLMNLLDLSSRCALSTVELFVSIFAPCILPWSSSAWSHMYHAGSRSVCREGRTYPATQR